MEGEKKKDKKKGMKKKKKKKNNKQLKYKKFICLSNKIKKERKKRKGWGVK